MTLKNLLKIATIQLTLLTGASFAVDVDKAAPGFSLPNIDGSNINLSDYKGKYVILEWTNHDCPYVKKHYGSDNMQDLQRKYTDKDVVWLSIISSAPGKQGYVESAEALKLTKDRNAAPSEVLFDPEGDVGKLYSAKTTPHMYIIDPEGMLRYAGAIDSIKSANPADIPKADNYVDINMEALLSGQDAVTKTSVPYGCSVKYKS